MKPQQCEFAEAVTAGLKALKCGLLYGVAVLALVFVVPARAAEVIETVTVTAEKHATDLQKTPIAISAFQGRELKDRDLRDVQQLTSSVPSFVYAQAVGQQQFSLRGIGTDIPNAGGEPGVAFYEDGVYMGSLFDANSAFDELERLEVLKGPQGTLYGRNAIGGAVNLISRLPSDTFEAEGSVLYGSYNRVQERAVVSGPLSSELSARLSIENEDRDGYRINLFNGKRLDDAHWTSVRGSVLYQSDDNFTVVVRADFRREHDTSIPNVQLDLGRDPTLPKEEVQTLPTGGHVVNDPLRVFNDFPDFNHGQTWGTSATATWNTGAYELKSITAYRNQLEPLSIDSDGTDVVGLHIANQVNTWQVSQEIQARSQYEGSFNWIAGIFAMRQHDFLGVNALFSFGGFVFPFISQSRQSTTSLAGYGEAYFDFGDGTRLTGGLRYSYDSKSFSNSFGLSGSKPFVLLTPKIGLEHQFSDDVFAYVTISEGFKGGGFDIFGGGESFGPEHVWAYDAGLKTQSFNKRLQANIDVFYYDYSNMQVTQFPGNGTEFVVNAASARTFGAELDFEAIATDWLHFDGSVGYLDAKFTKFETADLLDPVGAVVDLSGNHLIRAPELSLSLGVDALIPLGSFGQANVRGEYAYVSRYFFSVFNRSPAVQPPHSLVNVFIKIEPDASIWQLNFYARNLTNSAVLASAFEQPGGGGVVGSFQAPRTFGVSVTFHTN